MIVDGGVFGARAFSSLSSPAGIVSCGDGEAAGLRHAIGRGWTGEAGVFASRPRAGRLGATRGQAAARAGR
ncbi:hypothetical protein, partial [Burkholderia thailandensis]